MGKLTNLSASEKEKVTCTIERLALQTGKQLNFEIMPLQDGSESALLEIAVNGRYAKPIRLSESESTEATADTICRELEKVALSLGDVVSNTEIGANNSCPFNPKYNGRHSCPQCNQPAYWTCVDMNTARVRIECSGNCGIYEKSYSELMALRSSESSKDDHIAA